MSLRHIIDLNLRGVLLLAAGNNKNAVVEFSRALAKLHDMVKASKMLSDTLSLPSNIETESPSHLCQSDFALPSFSNTEIYICGRPILILPDDHEEISQVQQFSFLLEAALLFNMALAWHQDGLVGGREMSLRQAAWLYNRCCISLENVPLFSFVAAGRGLCAMALNNVAQIYHDQCDYNMADFCLHNLSICVSSSSVANGRFLCNEIEGILLNLIHCVPPTVARAA